MYNKRMSAIFIALFLTLLMVFGVFLTTSVLAVEPEYMDGNDKDLPSEVRALDSYKFDPVPEGTTTRSGITIDVYNTNRGQEFDWDSNRTIAYVFVKGGPGGNLYDYTPGANSGNGLHAPLAPSGDWYGLSHITFYFADEELTGELLITKQFDLNDVEGDVDFPASITVEVTGDSYPNGELVTIDIDPSTGYGEELLENLIPGDYDVEELDFDGSEAWDSDIVGSPAEVVAGATPVVEVNITNTYLTGELLITKQFDLGDVIGDVDFPASITVEVTGDSYPNGELVTIDIDSVTGYGEELLENLIPGDYYVEELEFEGSEAWDSDIVGSPATVVAGALPIVEVNIFNNFIMAAETAWAAHDVGVYRYNPGRGGNWATYVKYEDILADNGEANIYAGQFEYVGYVLFIENGSSVEIEVYLDGWAFEPGTTNLYVQDYSSEPSGNPAPGRFDYKATESGLEASIRVPLNDYYGIHLNVYPLY
ncbi:MAG: hypothetical protein D5S01_09125 [Halanaerobium sp. MSAO_Bac5]|nr:MAG: hypothetical protein D5S01_09125 [Halanaerobium sp. MSAO_Bac5]